ncbi:MAG: sigma-70 family RNA polymerase sigma factor [Myxococcales bacterium]|nr:sigma-70 family RNA polymerase sigma factor [Myxococcales bacterium]
MTGHDLRERGPWRGDGGLAERSSGVHVAAEQGSGSGSGFRGMMLGRPAAAPVRAAGDATAMTWDDESSDRALLEAWRGGDRAAADRLIARHGPRVYGFFATKVAHAVDELCQQTFADCVAGPEPVEADGARNSVRGQLFAAARRRLLDHFGRAERNERPVDPLERSVADLEHGMSERVAAHDDERRLQRALRQLPLDAQVALELHYWEGMTVAEISGVVQAPEPLVEERLAEARQRLRARLEQQEQLTGHTVDSRMTEDERRSE